MPRDALPQLIAAKEQALEKVDAQLSGLGWTTTPEKMTLSQMQRGLQHQRAALKSEQAKSGKRLQNIASTFRFRG